MITLLNEDASCALGTSGMAVGSTRKGWVVPFAPKTVWYPPYMACPKITSLSPLTGISWVIPCGQYVEPQSA